LLKSDYAVHCFMEYEGCRQIWLFCDPFLYLHWADSEHIQQQKMSQPN